MSISEYTEIINKLLNTRFNTEILSLNGMEVYHKPCIAHEGGHLLVFFKGDINDSNSTSPNY
jgi:hypothetical protein